jgi:hypothetical protein
LLFWSKLFSSLYLSRNSIHRDKILTIIVVIRKKKKIIRKCRTHFFLFLIDLNKLMICPHRYYVREHTQQAIVWTPANKASISSYIYIYACRAMLFTLNKVTMLIDVCEDWTAWIILELSSSYQLIEMFKLVEHIQSFYYSHLSAHGQYIDCWRKSFLLFYRIHTAGSFRYLDVHHRFFQWTHKKKKKKKKRRTGV